MSRVSETLRAVVTAGTVAKIVGAMIAIASATLLIGAKLQNVASLPAKVDSAVVLMREHTIETKGVNARLDKLLCVETSFTQREKLQCLRLQP